MYISFDRVAEPELRQWVEANPRRVNDRDSSGYTPLIAAVSLFKSVPLVLRLLTEKGADVNAADRGGWTALHYAHSLAVLNALLDGGADPTLLDSRGSNPLMIRHLRFALATRLLQDPRVQVSVNLPDSYGCTALYSACRNIDHLAVPALVQLLLKTGADLDSLVGQGETLLNFLERDRPNHPQDPRPSRPKTRRRESLLPRQCLPPRNGHHQDHPSLLSTRPDGDWPALAYRGPRTGDGRRRRGGRGRGGKPQVAYHASLACGAGGRGRAARRVSGRAGPAHAVLGPVTAYDERGGRRRRRAAPARIKYRDNVRQATAAA